MLHAQEWNLLLISFFRDDILPSSGQDIRDILQEWRISTLDYDETQKLSVTRRPESLWSHAVRVYSRGSFNVQKVLKVNLL